MALDSKKDMYMVITLHRRINKIKQPELAELIGLAQPAYSKFESGQRKITATQMNQLINYLELSPSQDDTVNYDLYFEAILQSIYYDNAEYQRLFNLLSDDKRLESNVAFVIYHVFRLLPVSDLSRNKKDYFRQLQLVGKIADNLPADLKIIYLYSKGRYHALMREYDQAYDTLLESTKYECRDYRIKALITESFLNISLVTNQNVRYDRIAELESIYQRDLNFKHILSIKLLEALFEMQRHNYTKAIDSLSKSLFAIQWDLQGTDQYIWIIRLLMVCLLLSHQYERIISYPIPTANTNVINLADFYKDIALYLLGRKEEAEEGINRHYSHLTRSDFSENEKFYSFCTSIILEKRVSISGFKKTIISEENPPNQLVMALLLLHYMKVNGLEKSQSLIYEELRQYYFQLMGWEY